MTPIRLLAFVLAAGIAVGAFFAGRALHGGGSTASAFDLSTPAYQQAPSGAAVSRGGYTGFGDGGGLDGSVLVAGRVSAVGPDSLTIETPGGPSSVRITSDVHLRRIDAAEQASLTPGVSVLVLLKPGTDVASGVLLLSGP